MKKTITFLFCALACHAIQAQETRQRYVGGDISALPLYEKYNSPYKDVYGNNISDLITFLTNDCGWNTFRVRIFVNPSKKDHDGSSNPSVCQDLAYVNFHYSDTWVDATHIQAPAAWQGASDASMTDSVAEYTRRVLDTLNAAGATPDLVQVGNEIMYGLCGIQVHPYDKAGDNWTGYLGLLNAGCMPCGRHVRMRRSSSIPIGRRIPVTIVTITTNWSIAVSILTSSVLVTIPSGTAI